MTHILDHVFVMCAQGAPEAERLRSLGIREGSGNVHPGQGTACRRFFFQNVYLELLWVHDAVEAQSAVTRPTRLFERWSARRTGASPFGVVLRSAGPDADEPPFPTWPYHPSYLPPDVSIDVAEGTLLSEPAVFHFRPPRRPGVLASEATRHEVPLGEVVAASIGVAGPSPRSPALGAVEAAGLVSFPTATEHVLHLDFAIGARERSLDLRPELPVVLRF